MALFKWHGAVLIVHQNEEKEHINVEMTVAPTSQHLHGATTIYLSTILPTKSKLAMHFKLGSFGQRVAKLRSLSRGI
jgi:hypothetical protein